MRSLIAFSGRMGAGKTTAANFLVEEYGYRKVAFADALKRVTTWVAEWLHAHGCPADLATALQDKHTPLGRRWLQEFGTDCMRAILPDVWVRAAMPAIAAGMPRVTVDDVRFRNEALALRRLGFRLVRVETDPTVRALRLRGGQGLVDHPSELDLEAWRWDAVIDGGLPLDAFREAVRALHRNE